MDFGDILHRNSSLRAHSCIGELQILTKFEQIIKQIIMNSTIQILLHWQAIPVHILT